MPDARLSDPLATILTALVEDRIGMHYELRDAELFASRVAARALESGFESLLDYYYFLRYDDADGREFDALVETLVVKETYFFRELDQLVVLVDHFLAPKVKAGKRPRVWCAACATGEEPLTLAMLLDERGLAGRVDLVASDVSQKALAHARAGLYGGRSLRVLSDRARAAWFVEGALPLRVRPDIHASVNWARVNLLEFPSISALGSFDAVLCRNVLIYFSEATVARVTASLGDTLVPDGVLLVGASESLLRFGTRFQCEEYGGAFFYRVAR